ncbi:Fc.00g033000.m01.CDS01 [Cosmosporella sp. VM-42]
MPSGSGKRAIRVAGASGGFTDRQRAMRDLAKNCDVDVIVGDWMSECTMTAHGALKVANQQNPSSGAAIFDPCFMSSLSPALPFLKSKNVKLAVNAGASDAEALAKEVKKEVDNLNLDLKIAWIEGDEVMEQVNALRKSGEKFTNLDTGKDLADWGFEPIYAQCYLGGMGIAEAFKAGADIIICGRVADAAPTIGAAAWWHGWDRSNFDALAGSLIAGHLIECSSYATGGYYSGFKALMDGAENLGFPIAAIEASGETNFTKEAGTGGEMSVATATTQLLYEIQGPLYYNSDVTANIEGIKFEQIGKDEVRMTGVKGLPPPPTTKVGITAKGGYQAEFHYLLCGLDIKEKAAWTEKQIRYSMRDHIHKFSLVRFHLVGSCPENPEDQDSATVDFRIFVQTKDPSVLGMGVMTGANFTRWCMENFLQSCPGATIVPDQRQSAPKSIYEYWVALLPQSVVNHRACLEWNGQKIDILEPKTTKPYPRQQPSYETDNPADLSTAAAFGPTTRGPLGWIVLGRSGDKASDANVGFFVRHDEEWDWLRSLLTIDKVKQMLGPREYLGHGIDRFELPHIRAVHFLIHDHLDRGFNSTSSLDGLGKNLCEYLRSKHVDVPQKFLVRGKV